MNERYLRNNSSKSKIDAKRELIINLIFIFFTRYAGIIMVVQKF